MAFRDLLPDLDFRKLDSLGFTCSVRNGVCYVYLNGSANPLVSSSDKGFIFNFLCGIIASAPAPVPC